MRVVLLLVAISSLSVVWAQQGKKEDQPQPQPKIPTTLAEAHVALERIFSTEELAKIDVMPSEDGMIQYHMPFGTGLRNSWGLWRGSPLAKHMQELGFAHPDDMSGVILETFWCKRHGQDFRLKERAAEYKKYWDDAKKAQEEQESREKKVNAALRDMMMGLRFEKGDVPVVRVPAKNGLSVRFLCPFRGGVFLTAYCQGSISSLNYVVTAGGYYVDPTSGELRRTPEVDDGVLRGLCHDPKTRELRKMKPGEDFYTLGFYFDLTERKIHRIRVEEVNNVCAAVVAGERAWFAGMTNGKPVLVGVGDRDRLTVPLPQEDEIPDLGQDGQSLLAVYPKTIYRLADREWAFVHSGDILLPRSGLPPQRHGDRVFLRDEGRGERSKRLWWLTLGEHLHLSVLDRDTELAAPPVVRGGSPNPILDYTTPEGLSGWDRVSSYCVTKSGDLWACVEGDSLLRRSKEGRYSIAIMNNSLQFTPNPVSARRSDQAVSVSAVTLLSDDTLLLAGDTGLYRLKGNELVQELAFASEGTAGSNSRASRQSDLSPNTIRMLDDRSYVIGCGSWMGVYLLRKDDDGQWKCLPLDDLRDVVVW